MIGVIFGVAGHLTAQVLGVTEKHAKTADVTLLLDMNDHTNERTNFHDL